MELHAYQMAVHHEMRVDAEQETSVVSCGMGMLSSLGNFILLYGKRFSSVTYNASLALYALSDMLRYAAELSFQFSWSFEDIVPKPIGIHAILYQLSDPEKLVAEQVLLLGEYIGKLLRIISDRVFKHVDAPYSLIRDYLLIICLSLEFIALALGSSFEEVMQMSSEKLKA